jgi:2-polyprenyl-3-methyl-5-hydroxy-6-metoxy-1,4-benzoquinol methylase
LSDLNDGRDSLWNWKKGLDKSLYPIVSLNTKPVPRGWFPDLNGCDVLCLASGGGQQGPVLAAAGANVTVFDISSRQLAQDRLVAEREVYSFKLCDAGGQSLK